MTWVFFSYVLFCNYCFEPTIFHMPNSIKLRNWSTWLLLFLFFNSFNSSVWRWDLVWHFSPCWRPQVNAQITAWLQLNTWVLGDVDSAHHCWHCWVRHSLLWLSVPQAAARLAPSPSETLLVVLSGICPAKVFAVFSPLGFSSWRHHGCEEPNTWLVFSLLLVSLLDRGAKNTMLTLQHQGNSEIAVSSFMFCFFSWRVLKCLSYLVK